MRVTDILTKSSLTSSLAIQRATISNRIMRPHQLGPTTANYSPLRSTSGYGVLSTLNPKSLPPHPFLWVTLTPPPRKVVFATRTIFIVTNKPEHNLPLLIACPPWPLPSPIFSEYHPILGLGTHPNRLVFSPDLIP